MPASSTPSLPAPYQGKTDKAGKTRARILETALSLVREKGYDRATMRAMAREAGVSLGNIYNYYAGKEALLTFPAVVSGWQRRWALRPQRPAAPAVAALRRPGEAVRTTSARSFGPPSRVQPTPREVYCAGSLDLGLGAGGSSLPLAANAGPSGPPARLGATDADGEGQGQRRTRETA